MGRRAAVVWAIAGATLVLVPPLVDLRRLLAYRATFPGSDDWMIGMAALAVAMLLGIGALVAARLEWRGRRASGWLVGPPLFTIFLLAAPLFAFPRAAGSPQMAFYTMAWSPALDLGAAAAAALVVAAVRWWDGLSAGSNAGP